MQGRYRLLKLFPAAVICMSSFAATSVQADDDRYSKMNWEESLQLTEEQQQNIRRIENDFRRHIQEMDKASAEQRKDEFERMREEIRSVLTEEQRELARKQMEDQQKKLQLRNLSLLARALDLEPAQKQDLKQTILAQQANWPMDKEQWDNFREAYDKRLHEVLTDEQMNQLEQMRERQRQKWQHHTMEMLNGDSSPQATTARADDPSRRSPPESGSVPGPVKGMAPPPHPLSAPPDDLEEGLPPELMSPGDPSPADMPPPGALHDAEPPELESLENASEESLSSQG